MFIEYKSINDILNENELLLSEGNSSGYKIDAPTIFKIFISEFNDYEEMISVLLENESVLQIVKELDEDKKNNTLLNYAKLFQIKAPVRKGKEYLFAFEWSNPEEGLILLNKAINLTLSTVKNTLINDIDRLATSVDLKTNRSLEKLKNEIELIELTHKEKTRKHIQFLMEQSAIAKELGIETNNLDSYSLLQSSQNGVSMTISLSDVPFYLRGSNAIDKEIDLIKNRSEDIQLLMADGYLEAKQKMIRLENTPSSFQVRRGMKTIENDNYNDWIEYNTGLSNIKSKNEKTLYITFSILLGLVVGVSYILIVNIFRSRKLKN